MKTNHYVAVFALLNALTLCFTGLSAGATDGKKESSHRGGAAKAHMSAKGVANTNAQWSADPERGLARSEERHKLHPQGETKTKPTQAKHKGSRKTR